MSVFSCVTPLDSIFARHSGYCTGRNVLEFSIKEIYNAKDTLVEGATIHTHKIPPGILSSLDEGDYPITVTFNDSQQAGTVLYRVVPIPTVSFTNLAPNELRIPMNSPISITGQWSIQGEQMNNIAGSSELLGITTNINQLN